MPYVFARAGFGIGMFWLMVLGAILIYVSLAIGEVSLRTKGIHHIPGYASLYLGEHSKKIVFFALVFGIYSALIAYLIGEGESLSRLFFNTTEYAIYFGIAFWLGMTVLLKEGIRGLKKIEPYGVVAFIAIIIGIFFWLIPSVDINNISYINTSNFFVPFGIVLFALMGFSAVPELRRMIKGSEKLLKKAILVGMLIPIVLYALFAFVFVGILGENVPEIATLAFGNIVVLLGIFTMFTSYFVLSFVIKDVFTYDFYKTNFIRFFFVSLLPLLLYLIVSFYELLSFIRVLAIGGVISGGIVGVLALVMNLKAKKLGKRKPEYSIPMNWPIIVIISIVFIAGVVAELFF
ncbi:hypothetical protein IIB49_02895 [Patescibacteria group bacterium]|nr:hypothetical protein [Patescibacteria group bacterium]